MLRRLLPCACVIALHAATLQQLTTTQLVNSSTAIVRGTVTGSHAALTKRTVFTHYTVQVSETWKGSSAATVDVALPGGAFNGMRQSYPGVPLLQIGGDYVLFLWTGKSGMTQITGYHQGIYLVGQGNQGESAVSRQPAGELMLGPNGKPVADRAVSMGLNQLKAAVGSVLHGASAQ